MKTCTKCMVPKDETEFSKNARTKSGLQSWCKKCSRNNYDTWRSNNRDRVRKNDRAWGKANRAKLRDKQLKRQYNIDAAEYARLLDLQGGGCAICGTTTPGGSGTFHVDHDHLTGQVRGLLCSVHNQGLGLFQDSPTHLRWAADYLDRFAGKAVELPCSAT